MPGPNILGNLGAVLQQLTAAQQQRATQRVRDSQVYQNQAQGDLDVARANDLTAVTRALGPVTDSIKTRGLEATLADPDLMGALAGAYRTKPEALSLLPGATPDNKLTFALAGGHNVTKNDVFSIPDREAVRDADSQDVLDKATAEALARPITAGPGARVVAGVGDPRGDKGDIMGPTTDAVEKGKIRARIAAGDTTVPAAARQGLGGGGLSIQSDGKGGFSVTTGDATVGLPKSTATNEINQNIALRNFKTTIGRMRGLATQDPTIFGTVGNVRRIVQDVGNQGEALSKLFGGDFSKQFASAASQMSALGLDPKLYDPKLDQLHKAAILAAYQAAGALAGQSGRGVSDKDVKLFQRLIGDPTQWLSTQANYLNGLDLVEGMLDDMLSSTNQNITQGADVSFGQKVTIGGKNYTVGKRLPSGEYVVDDGNGHQLAWDGKP
jgi:hypothetical protein